MFVIISIIIGFLILAVKILSSVEVKHSKPHTPKPLEERLKMLPDSAKQLSDEAKLIFPEQLNQPELFYFHWTHQKQILHIKVPIDQLDNNQLKTVYFNRFKENGWLKIENEYQFLFEHALTKDQTCIDKEIDKSSNYRSVKFALEGSYCY